MRFVAFMILFAFPLLACGGSDEAADASAADTPAVAESAEEVPEGIQVVEVSVEGMAYVFSPATVQAGLPVRLVFDPAGLPGCSRDIALPEFDIEKLITEDDAIIEFTPEAQGPIEVACTMNMYQGTIQAQ